MNLVCGECFFEHSKFCGYPVCGECLCYCEIQHFLQIPSWCRAGLLADGNRVLEQCELMELYAKVEEGNPCMLS